MMSAGIFSIVDEKPPHPHAISVFIFCFSFLSSPSSRLCFFSSSLLFMQVKCYFSHQIRKQYFKWGE
jgi:hypothetical protein